MGLKRYTRATLSLLSLSNTFEENFCMMFEAYRLKMLPDSAYFSSFETGGSSGLIVASGSP